MRKKDSSNGHNQDVSTLEDDEMRELGILLCKIGKVMKSVLKELTGFEVEKIYLASFCETKGWHFHVHIVPRYSHESVIGSDLLNEYVRYIPKNEIRNYTERVRKALNDEGLFNQLEGKS